MDILGFLNRTRDALAGLLQQKVRQGVQTVQQKAKQVDRKAAQTINQVPKIRLKGLEQLAGRGKNPVNPITLGDVARHTPVLGQAIKFGQAETQRQVAKKPANIGGFVKGIGQAGLEGASYVAPSLRIAKVAPGAKAVVRAKASFVNHAVPAAGLGMASQVANGERDLKNITVGGLTSAGIAGGIPAGAILGKAAGKATKKAYMADPIIGRGVSAQAGKVGKNIDPAEPLKPGDIKALEKLGFANPKSIVPIKLNGQKTVGGIDATPHLGDLETLRVHHIRISPEAQGKGLGRQAINQLFRENPSAKRIIGHATTESKPFWQKMGADFPSNGNTAFSIRNPYNQAHNAGQGGYIKLPGGDSLPPERFETTDAYRANVEFRRFAGEMIDKYKGQAQAKKSVKSIRELMTPQELKKFEQLNKSADDLAKAYEKTLPTKINPQKGSMPGQAGPKQVEKLAKTATDEDIVKVAEENPELAAKVATFRAEKKVKNPTPDTPKSDFVPLPTVKTFKVKGVDRVWRSTRSIIERLGEHGKALAGLLQTQRDSKELYLSKLEQSMPTLVQIARKDANRLRGGGDFENFVEATQGLAAPKNDKVAKAVAEWQEVHPTIRDRAVEAGLDVGDLGPTYYPHFIDYDKVFKDTNTYNKALNHLVESGQADSQEAAIKLLSHARDVSRNRQFGNLEASRLVDLPFYDKTPGSLLSYLNGSANRITQVEHFGQGDDKALALIAKAGGEGYDTEAMKAAYDVAVGAKAYSPTSEAVSRGIRRYITTTRLGLGALTNISQNVNTGIVTGNLRTMGAIIKQLDPKVRQEVRDTGVISEAILNDLRTQRGYESFGQKLVGKAINKITAPGFGAVEKFNRSVAATAGRDYALRLAQTGDIATLRRLGVTGEIKGTLTKDQQIQAARKIVEKTQFKVDPQDLPGWTDSPGGKLVAQFRTFSYNQGKFFSNEIIKPFAKGDMKPLGRLLAVLPIGYGLYEARRVIDGRPAEEDKGRVALESFSKVGGAGLALDLFRGVFPLNGKYVPTDRRVAMAIGTVGGPAVGQASQLVGAVSEAVQRKNIPKNNPDLEGKVALGKSEDKYTDATSLARFGLSQIPVVGTPIKNRVLPYKKEAEKEGRIAGLEGSEKLDDANKRQEKVSKELKPNTAKEDRDILLRYARLTEDGKKVFNRNPADKYKLELAQYNQEKDSLTSIKRLDRESTLNNLKVKSNYSQDVIDFYGLSNAEKNAYFKQDPDKAQELYDQAKKLALDLGKKISLRTKGGGGRRTAGRKGGRIAKLSKPPKPKVVRVGKTGIKTPRVKLAKAKPGNYRVAKAPRPKKVKLA